MIALSELRVEVVESRRHQAHFYRVKRELYRKDASAVIPLKRMEWALLDPAVHPFYEHARRQVWVAYRGKKPVGRIAAIVDDLFNSHHANRVGFFGFFDAADDQEVAELLLNTATKWLVGEGCEAMRGPMNPSMKSDFGVLIDGHSEPPFVMMAHTHEYYDRLLKQFGLLPVKQFYSFLTERTSENAEADIRFAKLGTVVEKLLKRFPEMSVRAGTQETLDPMLRDINRIGNVIRSKGWGFVPLTEAELDYMVKQLRRIIDPLTVIGAYIDDKMVGYNVSIPNVNWALKKCWGRWDWIRIPQLLFWLKRIPEVRDIALGVDPEIRAKGISALVTKPMTDQWHRFSRWEFGWVDEDNLPSMDALQRALPLRRYKTYQVYEMPIGAG
ncbi:MAG: hypothetical protein ABL888_02450 [Pirellulaceae bacterium]